MQVNSQLERIREVVERVAASEGLDVVDVELHGRGRGATVRIYLDKPWPEGALAVPDTPPPGVSLQDCQTVSQQVGMILDVEEVMRERYTLEVSSPGLDRKLVKPGDYSRFAGQLAAFELRPEAAPIGGGRKFRGRLMGQRDGIIDVQLESGEAQRVGFADVARANLVPEFPKKEKPGKGPRKPR
jgi:ribosome maturation factor RimP